MLPSLNNTHRLTQFGTGWVIGSKICLVHLHSSLVEDNVVYLCALENALECLCIACFVPWHLHTSARSQGAFLDRIGVDMLLYRSDFV